LPEPVVLSGRGDNVVDVTKWDGPAIAHITHSGGSNFAVWNYGTDGQRIDLLVNTVGSYIGTVPLDWLADEETARFEVTAGGDWEIRIEPLLLVRGEVVPSTFGGTGDDVVYLDGKNPDLLKVDAGTAESNFAIWAWGSEGRDLLVNDIAPYAGTVMVSPDAFLLVIHATGDWQIEVTSR
jgi:hypothetical protein